VHAVSDGSLAALSVDNTLRFSLGVQDASGIYRGTSGATNMHISVGSVIVDDLAHFSASESTPTGQDAGISTNVWRFDVPLAGAAIDSLYAARTNIIRTTIPDRDDDRASDQIVNVSQQYGYLVVNDDDEVGPVMGNLQAPGSAMIFATGFENADGWTNATYASAPWTQDDPPEGLYYGYSISAGLSFQRRGIRGVGLNSASDGDYLRFPPVDNPGSVMLWASLSSGTGPRALRMERADGDNWINCGEFALTSTNWTQLVWTVDYSAQDVTLRVARVGSEDQTIQIDDLAVYSKAVWISTTQVSLVWNAAGDASGLHEYRYVAPTENSSIPAAVGDGFLVNSDVTVTNVRINITGNQGVLTGFVFAVDDDQDRSNDRAKGGNASFVVKVDTNPPPLIDLTNATVGLDESSEMILQWDAAPHAGERSDGATLSPWKSYVFYYTTENREPTTNDASIQVFNGPTVLGMRATEEAVLSNFVYGSVYRVSIAGMDEAGNVGPLSASKTIPLLGFRLTNGAVDEVAMAPSVEWAAVENREYDLLYVDTDNFSDTLSNKWKLANSGVASLLVDTGAQDRPAVTNLENKIRYYRVAGKDRWLPDRTQRSASEEIYMAMCINLRTGLNYVALPGIPDNPTAGAVLGHNLSAGESLTDSNTTRVSWYEASSKAHATNELWLCKNPLEWRKENDSADNIVLPLRQAFIVESPTHVTNQYILFVGRVPTNSATQLIKGGTRATGIFNLVSFTMPRWVHPSDMNLTNSGFKGGPTISQSDQLIKYNRVTQRLDFPIWFKTSDKKWYFADGAQVGGRYFGPDDGIIIYSVHPDDWVWTNKLLYNLPTRFMSP
jgi:hypothetical protein